METILPRTEKQKRKKTRRVAGRRIAVEFPIICATIDKVGDDTYKYYDWYAVGGVCVRALAPVYYSLVSHSLAYAENLVLRIIHHCRSYNISAYL